MNMMTTAPAVPEGHEETRELMGSRGRRYIAQIVEEEGLEARAGFSENGSRDRNCSGVFSASCL